MWVWQKCNILIVSDTVDVVCLRHCRCGQLFMMVQPDEFLPSQVKLCTVVKYMGLDHAYKTVWQSS